MTLAVARGAGSGSGPFSYNATNGLIDGELITLTTDGSEGWDFGPAPKDLGTMGFGQGFVQDQPSGTNLTDFTDPVSGTDWRWERANTSRIIAETAGLKAILTSHESGDVGPYETSISGGWLTWSSAAPLAENEKVYVTSLAKADWAFINTQSATPLATVQTVDSATQITLAEPWSGATDDRVRILLSPSNTDSTNVREDRMYLSVTNGSNIATLNPDSWSNFTDSGAQAGDYVMSWAAVQWKGLRPSGVLFDFNDPNQYWKNNNSSFGWPLNGVVGGVIGGTNYDLAGQPVTKGWCRTESQINLGDLGGNGTITERALYPTVGDGYAEFGPASYAMHNSSYRWQHFQFQEYIQYLTQAKMWRTDTAVQVGTFARFELADGATPAETTTSTWLPPAIAQWTPGEAAVYLWKGLLSSYAGNYIHAYDLNGVFRGAIQL